jgi:HK97 family phage portal protein
MPNNTLLQRFISLFVRQSPETPKTSLSRPAEWLTSLYGTKSASGQKVTPQTTISLPAFWRAINIVAETVASLSFEVIKEEDNGDVVVQRNHPVHNLINLSPSPFYTSFSFRHTCVLHAMIWGNSYVLIQRDRTGLPEQLVIIHPDDVEVLRTKREIFYHIEDGVYDGFYASHDIIHVSNLSFDGIQGLNVIKTMADSFGLGLASREYASTYHKKGTMIAGWVEFPEKMKPEQYQRLKNSFRMEYSGANNAGSTPVLEGGGKYHNVTASLGDSQSIDTMKFNIADISRMTGVPMHMLSELDRSTNNNIEQQSLELGIYTIRPWVKRFEQEYKRKIFRVQETGILKTRMNMESLLRADTKSRAELYKSLWGIAAITVNEIRKQENLPALPGGDYRFAPMNSTPLDLETGLPIYQPKSAAEEPAEGPAAEEND